MELWHNAWSLATQTGVENPSVGSCSVFPTKPNTLYKCRQGEGEFHVIGMGREKCRTAGTQSYHDPMDNKIPFPLPSLRAMPRCRMQYLHRKYKRRISWEKIEKLKEFLNAKWVNRPKPLGMAGPSSSAQSSLSSKKHSHIHLRPNQQQIHHPSPKRLFMIFLCHGHHHIKMPLSTYLELPQQQLLQLLHNHQRKETESLNPRL